MKQRLRTKVWWPGIDKKVNKPCKTCHGCQLVPQPSTAEPIIRTELSSAPCLEDADKVRDHDSDRQDKGKMYADCKRNACESEIAEEGDKVLLRQKKENAIQTVSFNSCSEEQQQWSC